MGGDFLRAAHVLLDRSADAVGLVGQLHLDQLGLDGIDWLQHDHFGQSAGTLRLERLLLEGLLLERGLKRLLRRWLLLLRRHPLRSGGRRRARLLLLSRGAASSRPAEEFFDFVAISHSRG
jgi:hypothetical protein